MKQWHHAPMHLLDKQGTYMVTSGTYQKEHFFKSKERLNLLHDQLLLLAEEFGWFLQAWAVFSNHYHFVALSPANPKNLKQFISKLHGNSARQLNQEDDTPGRQVWHQFWDTRITYQRSYLARLNYVQQNPVKHKLVKDASSYPWCSASWFEKNADPSFFKMVRTFKTDSVNVFDDF